MSERSLAAISVEECVITHLWCPMGCGQTIIAYDDNGDVECSNDGCPDNRAVEKLLDQSTVKHVVRINHEHWSAMHPLFERIGAKLLDCGIDQGVHDAMRFGESGGDFLMWYDNDDEEWKWNRIADATS